MNEHHAQIFRVPSFEDLNEKLDNVKVHVLEPEASEVENEAGLLIRVPDHGSDGLDVVQDKRLHGLG
jgi:hypothetical protein